MPRFIYAFGNGKAEGRGSMRDLLGGKGAGLAQMSRFGLPVPPGFTITTEVCRLYYHRPPVGPGRRAGDYPFFIAGFLKEFQRALARLERISGRVFGDSERPLLVSVRSGAKFSMPGMMDTILNLGLNDRSVEGLARETGDRRFALDTYRRFIQMFGNVVSGIEKAEFDAILSEVKRRVGRTELAELSSPGLEEVLSAYQALYRAKTGRRFPQKPLHQLQLAVEAVFKSWSNPRAVIYRKANRIPEEIGTACTVMAMVFGNKGPHSGTGVGFTRNPATGERELYGEYLPHAQGEDVVAGIRTPQPLLELKTHLPSVFRQLKRTVALLERHYRDMQDFEFTVEEGRLYMLQTRTGKRTAQAALRAAVDMVGEGLISQGEAIHRVSPGQIDQLLRPVFDPRASRAARVLARGLPAGPGAASGRIIFDADRAVREAAKGPVLLLRAETNPDDIHGMMAAEGILTATGGMTSHAAVVGRGMGKVCVVGCGSVRIDEAQRLLRVEGSTYREGAHLSLNGFTGEVLEGRVPTHPSEILQRLERPAGGPVSPLVDSYAVFMGWVDRARRLRVRANADLPEDARTARRLGAEGIGLCRTEHMFFGPERLRKMLAMILAASEEERRRALAELAPLQKEDFKGIFREMEGLPVTIRTLDPPLHEFLPRSREEADKLAKELGHPAERLWAKSLQLHEVNPMLGHRGCRLGITHPEITEMQVNAIISAACELRKEGLRARPEIMIPLVGTLAEFTHQKAIVQRVAQQTMAGYKVKIPLLVGTMIEVPRAAMAAGEIAREAEFFSFGTNDLTQMVFGYSRDDYGKFIQPYLELKILPHDPFRSLDVEGVGRFVRLAVENGRGARRSLKLGVCGEHGGDPQSVAFFHAAGLDYVSCSPYRVPAARLAAAQAATRETYGGTV